MKTRILAALVLIGVLPPEAHPQGAGELHIEPYLFEASSGETVQAELGSLEVLENRENPASRRLTLRFIRFPATGPDSGPPIVYLAGGPGGSGISAARGSRFPLFMALRKYGDVIAYDQRGTGMSDGPDPASCPISRSYPNGQPLVEQSLRKLSAEVARECGVFWRRNGVDLSAYNTANSADDVATLASALGTDRLRLWGISYGTHLGLSIIRRYPDLVEQAVLAGVEGPDHTVKLPSYWSQQLGELNELIAADPATSERFPDLDGRIRSVLEQLDQEPARVEMISGDLRDTIRARVSRFAVEVQIIEALRDPSTMVAIPFLFERMAAGDFSALATATEIGGLSAMPEAMDAASGISADRLDRYLHEDSTLLLGGGDQLANVDVAEALGVADLGAAFRAPLQSEIPALFISGTLDGRTPVRNAVEVLEGFGNGRHLIIENGGHSDDLLLSSPRILEAIEAFFSGSPLPTLSLSVPPPNLSDGELPPPLSADLTDGVVGAYERGPADVWRIVRQGVVRSLDARGRETGRTTNLFLRLRGNGFPIAARSDSTFFIPFFGPETELRFQWDSAGRIAGLEFTAPNGSSSQLRPVVWDSIGFVEGAHWMVAPPLQLRAGESCDQEFPIMAALRSGGVDPERLEWTVGAGDDGFVDFEELYDGSTAGGVAHARLVLISDRSGPAELRIGTDDDARVYLRGELIHRHDGARHAWEEQDVVPIGLEEGGNELLVKVCNRDSDWRFNLRVTDPEGRSLTDGAGEGWVQLKLSTETN